MKKGYATSIDYDPRAEYDKYKNRLEDILSSVKTDFIESINSLESIASKK